MRFCPEHWASLRAAVESRGLTALIVESGKDALKNLASELHHGSTIDNFDPLMAAHNFIWANATATIRDQYGQNPLMVMAVEAEHPEWACPICALNWCHAEHERLCTQEGCSYPKGYDWSEAIETAADHALATWEGMKL